MIRGGLKAAQLVLRRSSRFAGESQLLAEKVCLTLDALCARVCLGQLRAELGKLRAGVHELSARHEAGIRLQKVRLPCLSERRKRCLEARWSVTNDVRIGADEDDRDDTEKRDALSRHGVRPFPALRASAEISVPAAGRRRSI